MLHLLLFIINLEETTSFPGMLNNYTSFVYCIIAIGDNIILSLTWLECHSRDGTGVEYPENMDSGFDGRAKSFQYMWCRWCIIILSLMVLM